MKRQIFLSLILWLISWVTTPMAHGQTVQIFYDECTEASADTPWETHNPTGGGSMDIQNPASTVTTSDTKATFSDGWCKVTGTTTDSAYDIFTFTPAPATAEYDVLWRNREVGGAEADNPHGAILRYQDSTHYYSVGTYYGSAASPDWRIVLRNGVDRTVLASYDLNTGTEGACFKAEWRNGQKTAMRDVACDGTYENTISTTDNTISAAGLPGYCFGACWDSADDDHYLGNAADNVEVKQLSLGQIFIISQAWGWIKKKLSINNALAQAAERTAWVINPKITTALADGTTVHSCKVNTMIDTGVPPRTTDEAGNPILDDEGNPVTVYQYYSSVNLVKPAVNWCLSYVRGVDPQPILDDPECFVIGQNADQLLDTKVSALTQTQRQRVLTWMQNHNIETGDITLDWTIEMVLHRIGRTLFPNFMARLNYVR